MTQSEKKLLIGFSIGAFLLANAVGWTTWLNKSKLQERKLQFLQQKATEYEGVKALAPEADAKREWIQDHLTAYADEAARETYLDRFFVSSATALGLTFRKNTPMEPRFDEHFIKSRYTGEVTGKWEDVLEFIYRLQQPQEFRFVPSLRLTAKKAETETEAGDVTCVVEVEKWWNPASQTLADEARDPGVADGSEQMPPDDVQSMTPGDNTAGAAPNPGTAPAPVPAPQTP